LTVLEDVSLSFGPKTIIADLGLRIGERDRIGLVGPNGSGKSTLLRVLVGEQYVDHGTVQRGRGVRIGYLPQDVTVADDRALLDYVCSSVPGRADLQRQLGEAEAEMDALGLAARTPETESSMLELAGRIADLHEHINHSERFFTEHEAVQILGGLGFTQDDLPRHVSILSGGWKMRAVLAALLFQQPDLLLLDEPTNHLDLPSVSWLAGFLKRYSQAFVLISHDRELLNEQASRIVSFETEGIRQYVGNYDQYQRQRAEEEVLLENKARNIERERERLQRFIDRFRAQATKASAVQSRVKALEKMDQVETFRRRKVMAFRFPSTARTVRETVRLDGVAKRFGERIVFPGVDAVALRGERIGVIGPNGAGKTTLLKMIAGELTPDGGAIGIGDNVQVGYYAQHHAETLDRRATVYQEVQRANVDAPQFHVRSVLGAFLFSGDDVDKHISVLSGGERARVALARLLINPGSLLLMDEPSNHLDLESSEVLAESLASYDGTLIFVSHNRSLIRRLATRIWNVEGGTVETYAGTLDEYMYSCAMREGGADAEVGSDGAARPSPSVPANSAKSPGSSGSGAPVPSVAPQRAAPAARSVAPAETCEPRVGREDERARKRREAERRQRRNEVVGPMKKRVADIESRITELDAAQKERTAQLADPAVYEDGGRRAMLLNEYHAATAKIEELTARWEFALTELEQAEAELTAALGNS
jgi:ATP-binding cassette subfamily F protein 3